MSLASLSSDGIHSDQILQSTWHWFPSSRTPCRFCCRHNLSWCVSHPLLHSHRDCSPTSGSQTSLFWPAGFSVSVLLSQLFLLSGPASLPPHQQSPGWSWSAPGLGWWGRTVQIFIDYTVPTFIIHTYKEDIKYKENNFHTSVLDSRQEGRLRQMNQWIL